MVVALDTFTTVKLSPSFSFARLDEFRFAGPDVHVVNTLASEALHSRGGLRYAHGLNRLQSSRFV